MDGVQVVEDDGGFVEDFLLDFLAVDLVGGGSGVGGGLGDGEGGNKTAWVEFEEVGFFFVGVDFGVGVREGLFFEEDPYALDLE